MAYSVCHGPLELKSEMLPEIHTMEKFYFPEHIIFLSNTINCFLSQCQVFFINAVG